MKHFIRAQYKRNNGISWITVTYDRGFVSEGSSPVQQIQASHSTKEGAIKRIRKYAKAFGVKLPEGNFV
jgi:hypothetical protein